MNEPIKSAAAPQPLTAGQAVPEIADDLNWLLSDMDAMKWANEFCKRNPSTDHGLMLTWFSCAIMTGFDEANRRAAAPVAQPAAQDERERVLIEFYNASCHWESVCGHPEATVEDERKAEERFATAGIAVQRALAATPRQEAQPAVLYTCKSKGGEYKRVSMAIDAGTSRGAEIVIYEGGDGVWYFRTANDFYERMEVLAAPSQQPAASPADPLKYAVDVLTDHLNDLVGECLAGKVTPKTLSRMRGYLPSRCEYSFNYKPAASPTEAK